MATHQAPPSLGLQAGTLEWVAISFSNAWKWKVKVKLLSHAQLLTTSWTAAYQAPPSMGFSRQEYWRGFHFLLQGIYLTQKSNLSLPHWRQILYPLSYLGSTSWRYLPITEKMKHMRHAEFLGPNSCGDGQNVHHGWIVNALLCHV